MPPAEHFASAPQWEWWILGYFFFGGISGGSYALGTLSQPPSSGTTAHVERAAQADTQVSQTQAARSTKGAPAGSGIRKFTEHFNDPALRIDMA